MIFAFPHGLIKVGRPSTPGAGPGLQGASSTKALPEGQRGQGSGRRSRHSPVSSSRPCLEGGRGLEPLDPRSGKPDARPGTDASSRAIFTDQWMQRRSRSWNWSCCSSPGSPRSAGPEGSARLSGPGAEFRHHSHGTRFSAHTISKSDFPIRIRGEKKSVKSHSTEKPESSNLSGSILPATVIPTSPSQGQLPPSWTSQQQTPKPMWKKQQDNKGLTPVFKIFRACHWF